MWISRAAKLSAAVGLLGVAASGSGTGCNKTKGDVVGPNRPTVLGDKCAIEERQSAPLIVDWPSSDRARLEAAVLRGAVLAVEVSACNIEPLWQCASTRRYQYASATSRTESETIEDEKSLYARVPVSAVSLEGKLASAGALSVNKTTVGRYESESKTMAEGELTGDCKGATHFVSAVDVGAFEFSAARSRSAAAEVKSGNIGGGGSASSDRELLSTDGNLERCAEAASGQAAPPDGCGAPIQIELTPLLPSLDLEAWRTLAIATSKEVMRQCHAQGTGTSVMLVLIEPDGSIHARRGPPPFGPPALNDCVHAVWESKSVEPFSGPALLAPLDVFVYPPSDHATFDKTIDDLAKTSTPHVPTREEGEKVGYPFSDYGITPAE